MTNTTARSVQKNHSLQLYTLAYVTDRIQKAEKCYILTMDGMDPRVFGTRIAVYDIDGVYFYLHMGDGAASTLRIFCMNYKPEILPTAKPSAFSKGAVALTAEPMATGYGNSAVDATLPVWVDKNQISLGGVVYEKALSDNFDLWKPIADYGKYLDYENTDEATIFALWEKIKGSEKCYILERNEYNYYDVIRAMYDIDGTYYFVTLRVDSNGARIFDLYSAPKP